MPGGNTIPTFPGGGGSSTPSGGGSSGGSSGSSGGGGTPSGGGSSSGGGGGGGGGFDPYKYAERKEREANRKAARKYLDQAATLGLQVKALRIALGKKGFRAALEQKLKNVQLVQRQSDADLREGYRERVAGLEKTASDNEKAAAGQGYANLTNRSRERSNAMSEAMAQGAGESDLLRTQQMSLRNWNANQNEVNRSYFDTQSSINASLADLTVDTKTARMNNALQSNADREQLWTNYYGQVSETQTQLGNVLGQQAEYYGLAQEAVNSKKTRKKRKHASAMSGNAFTAASKTAGKAWENPGVRSSLRNWEGAADFEGRMNNAQFAGASTELAPAERPEGSSLRKW